MKSRLLIVIFLCTTLVASGQRNGKKTDTGNRWIPGRLTMNNTTARDLDLDTTLTAIGFTSLNVVVVTDNADNFKFERDRFDIQVMNDFQLNYQVKEGFIGRTATFSLYIYSGKMIVYKKKYSIMFDGSRNPKLIML